MARWQILSHIRFTKFISRSLSEKYVQGQSPEPNIREYFYYIDHQGQLFLDDTKSKNFITCYKDVQFLSFFFRMLKRNNYERYTEDFAFVSLCGKERNFVRCDDVPIVFTHFVSESGDVIDNIIGDCNDKDDFWLVPNNLVKVKRVHEKFDPTGVKMLPETHRVYHPCLKKYGGMGLIKSSLAIKLSDLFVYERDAGELEPPTGIKWGEKIYSLKDRCKIDT